MISMKARNLNEIIVTLGPAAPPVPAPQCHRSPVWLGSSVVRVLEQCARGPGFESRSGHVLFPPL